jgi:RNA polymerase sigma-70 factor (ECF subfamily)
MADDQLVQGCKQQNPAAQRELYNRYSGKMLSVCYRYAQDRSDAEDMLQEAFIKVFTQIHTFRSDGAFEGWMRRIVVHTCINQLKKNKKFAYHLDVETAHHLHHREETVASLMQARQVVECIRALPVGYRTVLNLFAIEGYTHREIGEMLDIEESTSRSQYTRAKGILETVLFKKGILKQSEDGVGWMLALKNRSY